MQAFIKKYPVLTYFVLTFAISWGGILVALGPGGFTSSPDQLDVRLPIVVLALLAGPSVAGMLMTTLMEGKAGLLDLLSRLVRWRVDPRWYAVALLTAPLIALATLLPLSLTSRVFLPNIFTANDKASLLLSGVIAGLAGGFLEELGWTGFAVPRIKLRYGFLATGFVVGLLWGVWHSPTSLWGSSDSAGPVPLAIYVPVALFSFLPPYRVLMVWVYERTESLLLAMLMHASLIPSIFYVLTPPATGWAFVTYHLVLAAALWVIVAVVVLSNRGHVSRQPYRRQVEGNARGLGAGL